MFGPDLFGNTGLMESLPETLRNNRSVEVLEKSLNNKRLAHGILLHGDDLEELSQVAQAIASVLLETSQEKVATHPDFFTLRPAKKARQIRISGDGGRPEPNTMRWLLKDLMQTSNQGGHKVAVIYEADRMNSATANAFLKTLEEPPNQTTLFLLTCRPYDLLDTIRSRCFNFRIKSTSTLLQNKEWQEWLDQYSVWLDALNKLSHGASAKDRCDAVIHVYALIARFNGILKALGNTAWEKEKKSLPDNITSEETEALETGLRRGVRQQLWKDIETATCQFSRRLMGRGTPQIRALAQAIQDIEHSTLLNGVFNLKEDTALENMLLKSLRNWPLG